MSKKISISKSLMIVGVVLILAALAIIVYNVVSDYIAKIKSKDALDYINLAKEDEYNINNEIPTIQYNGINYIGIITIEKINVKLPVISSYSQDYLKIAPTLYQGNIYENNAVIIAHNYKSHFGNLDKLSLKDKVVFTDINGNEFNYEVVNKEDIDEKNSFQLDTGEWDLTLFTCKNIDMKFRTVVRLKRI